MLSEETSHSDGVARLNKYGLGPSTSSRTSPQPLIPQHSFHIIGRFLRILSVYVAHHYLVQSKAPVILFVFYCLLGSSFIFILIQRPWRGRSLPRTQWISAIFNGAIQALSFVFFCYGLRAVGPTRIIMAEYAGAVVSAISTMIFGRRGHRAAKLYGMVIMLLAFFLLSHGWAMGSLFFPHQQPTVKEGSPPPEETENVGFVAMVVPLVAGLLAALRRLLARTLGRAQAKKRLHTVTATSAVFMVLPFAILQLTTGAPELVLEYSGSTLRVYLLYIIFGIVLSFYVDSFAEDRLRIGPASLKHLGVTVLSILVLELLFKMDFSPLGFLLVAVLLGIGMHLSTSIEKKKPEELPDSNAKERRRQPGLASMLHGPLEKVFTDPKSTRIALFLLINTTFMVVEFVYGFVSNSLGLISDACHMLFDCAALAIGLYATYISRMDSPSKYAYGYGRFEVMSGYVNAVFLVLVAALIVVESIERILDPPEISTQHLLMVSVGGLLVNMIGLVFFHEAHHHAHGGSCSHGGNAHAHAHDHSHSHTHDEVIALPGGYSEHGHEAGDGHKHDGHHHEHTHFRSHSHDHQDLAHPHPQVHAHDHDHSHDHSHSHTPDHIHDHSHGHGDVHAHEHRSDGAVASHRHEDGKHSHGHDDAHCSHDHGHSSNGHGHGGKGCEQENAGADSCGHGHGSHEHEHGGEHDCVQESLSSGNAHMDHNMRGIFLHVLADTLGSVGVVISTLLIKYKGWLITDPACSIFISLLIIATVIPLLQNSAEVILQRIPRAAENALESILKKVERMEGVCGQQGAHFWSFTPKMVVGSLHVLVESKTDKQRVRQKVVDLLRSAGVTHVTVQVEDREFNRGFGGYDMMGLSTGLRSSLGSGSFSLSPMSSMSPR